MRLRVSVEAAPAYELVLSMAAPASAEVADSGLLDALTAVGQGSDLFWAHLLSVAVEAPAPRDAGAFLAHLSVMDASELRRRLAGYYVRWFRRLTPPEVMVRALAGDSGARRDFLASSEPGDAAWQAALSGLLSSPPERLKKQLLNAVEHWSQAVAARLATRQPYLRREAARVRAEAPGRAPAELIALAAHLEYVPEPGVERVLLIPSLVIWPDHHMFDHLQLKLICYPVEPPPPAGLETGALALLLDALADARRLEVLALLARGPLTAQELAERLEVPITTAIHHLNLLRRAGAVGGGGRGRPYAVERGLAAEVGQRLEMLLAASPAPAELARGRGTGLAEGGRHPSG